MGNFFKPWRRKIGVVTLLMALVSAGGWVRSLTITDAMSFGQPNAHHVMISTNAEIRWAKITPGLNRFGYNLEFVAAAKRRDRFPLAGGERRMAASLLRI